MDVLYYWKSANEDMKAGRTGWLKSSNLKVGELREGFPENIWLVRTPAGRKGEVTLLGRVKWTDKPVTKIANVDVQSSIFYSVHSEDSIWFEPLQDAEIATMSKWVRTHFPHAVKANFMADNGVQALRGDMLIELNRLTKSWGRKPFHQMLEPVVQAG